MQYILEIKPSMKHQFANLSIDNIKYVVNNINFEVLEQGQQLFCKGQKTDFAYLMVFGSLGFYDTKLSIHIDHFCDRLSSAG